MAKEITIDLMKHFTDRANAPESMIEDVEYVEKWMQISCNQWNNANSRHSRAEYAVNGTIEILQKYFTPNALENNPPPSHLINFANDVIEHIQQLKSRAGMWEEEMSKLIEMLEMERDFIASNGTKKITNHDQYGRPFVRGMNQSPTYC